jgi:hypothetical protein
MFVMDTICPQSRSTNLRPSSHEENSNQPQAVELLGNGWEDCGEAHFVASPKRTIGTTTDKANE